MYIERETPVAYVSKHEKNYAVQVVRKGYLDEGKVLLIEYYIIPSVSWKHYGQSKFYILMGKLNRDLLLKIDSKQLQTPIQESEIEPMN